MDTKLDQIIERLSGECPASSLEGIETRASWLRAVGEALEERAGDFAVVMAEEMGKPVREGRAEAEKCAWVCRHYAQHAASYLADEEVDTGRAGSTVGCAPLGTVLAIMPWNFPFWQAFRFVAPALVAGNRVLLKHASSVPRCAAAIAGLVAEASGRDDLLAVLEVPGRELAPVIADARVAAVTFTGSTEAGRKVAETAGRSLKKSVLELGGSDPYLVLEDADVARAAAICARARMVNGGQSCIAAKRLLVAAPVHDEFIDALREELASYVPGDPLDPETKLGPMARGDLRDELHAQVAASVTDGTRLVMGGRIPDEPELRDRPYYPATLVTGVLPGMRLFDEETFGPAAAVTRVNGEKDGIELANRTNFGLGAAVFTGDPERGHRVARKLRAGTVGVNAQVVSDPRLPFGGIKESGWGRELGAAGIREFVNLRTVVEEAVA